MTLSPAHPDSRAYSRSLAGAILAGIAFFATVNFILDPFQIYHPSFWVKDRYVYDYGRYQNAGIVNRMWGKNGCCGTVLLGTSMSQNFSPALVEKILGQGPVMNLAVPSEQPAEAKKMLEYVLSKDTPRPRVVVWELLNKYSRKRVAQYPSQGQNAFPAYLYDDHIYNDYEYLFSIDILTNFIKLIKGGKPYETVQSWYENYESDFNLPVRSKEGSYKFETKELESRNYIFENIDKVIIPAVLDNPDIHFIFFIPPMSRHFYATLSNADYNRYVAMQMHLVDKLENVRNAQFFSFDTIFPEVEDMSYFKDIRHYDLRVSEKIIVFISENKGLLDRNNLGPHFSKLTRLINLYIEKKQVALH